MKAKPVFIFSALMYLLGCGSAVEKGPAFSETNAAVGIVGGEVVDSKDPIAQVAALIELETEGSEQKTTICSGTVVAANFVVTAAHCFQEKTITKVKVAGQTISVVRVLIHPQYDRTQPRNRYDVALVQLVENNQIHYWAQLSAETPAKNTEVWIAGFGRTDVNTASSQVLNKAKMKLVVTDYNDSESVVFGAEKQGACFGDSGGPAYQLKNGEVYLWGIDSRVPPENASQCGRLEVYSKISTVLAWIKSVIS